MAVEQSGKTEAAPIEAKPVGRVASAKDLFASYLEKKNAKQAEAAPKNVEGAVAGSEQEEKNNVDDTEAKNVAEVETNSGEEAEQNIVAEAEGESAQANIEGEEGSQTVAEEAEAEVTAEEDVVVDEEKPGKKVFKQLDKRTRQVHELTEQNQKLQDRLAEVEKRLQQMPKAEAKPKDFGDYTRRTDLEGLRDEFKTLQQSKRTLDTALLGKDKIDESGNEYVLVVNGQKIDRDTALKWKQDIDRKVEDQLPERIRTLELAQQGANEYRQRAAKELPWYSDRNSELSAQLNAVKQDPNYAHLFSEIPDFEYFAAHALNSVAMANKPKAQVVKPKIVAAKPIVQKRGPSADVPGAVTDRKAEYQKMLSEVDAKIKANPRDRLRYLAEITAFKTKHKIK